MVQQKSCVRIEKTVIKYPVWMVRLVHKNAYEMSVGKPSKACEDVRDGLLKVECDSARLQENII